MAGFNPILKAILPKAVNKAAAEALLRAEMEKIKPFLVKDFEMTTSSWQHDKPTFQGKLYISPAEIKIVVALTGNKLGASKWRWLNYGTRAHIIRARTRPRLRFRLGGSPKTYPGKLWSTGGAPATGPWRSPYEVNHPGIKAREWDRLIKERNEKAFYLWTQAAVREALRATGHLFIK